MHKGYSSTIDTAFVWITDKLAKLPHASCSHISVIERSIYTQGGCRGLACHALSGHLFQPRERSWLAPHYEIWQYCQGTSRVQA